MRTLRETCQEYFRRRLSEGWKCISLEEHNAVLLSPNGVRRELDLRNDVETLRPNAAGDETNIPSQYPASGYHWQKVDDITADDSDYIFNTKGDGVYYRDLYGLPGSAIAGTINKVTIYFRAKSSTSGCAKPALKSNSTVTDGTEVNLINAWANYSQVWATNPADGEAWELSDINSLQAGVSLKDFEETCFTGDTRIALSDGSYKKVKDIRPGDRVAYYDFIERKIKFTTVTKINEHSADEMGPYYLVLNKVLKATPGHPLDKPDGTVITAGEVKVGDFLQGETGSIEIFSVEKVWERVKTYSLETETKHYFIDGFSDMAKPASTYCSQLYVEVDYTFVPPTPPPPPVVEAAAAPEYQKREIARIGTEAEATLESALSRVTEVSVATGDATSGSTTTLKDTGAVWEVDRWKDSVVEITHVADSKHYFVTITSNTADTLTFDAIAVTVAAGDHYEIRLSVRIATISGQVVKISGQTVSIETPTMLKTGPVRTLPNTSGGVVLHSGSVKAAVVKALTDNTGVVLVGGSGDRPWYESVGSAQGMILAAGEAQSKDVSNFDAIYVVAQISGDKVSFDGVN